MQFCFLSLLAANYLIKSWGEKMVEAVIICAALTVVSLILVILWEILG